MNTYRSCTFIATLQATEFGEGQPIAMVGIGQIGADGFPISCNGPFLWHLQVVRQVMYSGKSF